MSVTITIKVVPSSGKSGWRFDKQQRLTLFLKSEAQQGKANREVVKVVAKALKLPQEAVKIVQGMTMRTKVVRIETDKSLEEVEAIFGVHRQQSFLK